MSNRFSIISEGKTLIDLRDHACFACVSYYSKPTILEYHCFKYDNFGDADKWYLKFLKRVFRSEFDVVSEDNEKFIFNIKMGPDRVRNLTILTFFRYLDKNEANCTRPRPILEKSFQIKGIIKNAFHSFLMSHAIHNVSGYGHFVTFTGGCLNVSYCQKGTFPSLREFIINFNNSKIGSVNSKLIKTILPDDQVKEFVKIARKDLLKGYKLFYPKVDKATK